MGKEQYNIRKGMEVENTKNTYFSRQIFCALNQFAVIIYLSYMAYNGHYIESNYLVHFLSLSLLFFDAAYISYKNVKCNKVLNHFSLLLLLLGWQFLLYLFDFQPISKAVSMLLLPVCFYQSAYFIQTFLFQGSAYRGQKALLVFLKISCVTAIICFFFSDRAFFTAYQLQFFISTLALAVVGIIQRKRIVFVLKSQRKRLLFPLALVVIPFVIYLFVFHREAEYMASMGSYIPVMLAFVCIHSIVFQYHPQQVQFLTLSGGYIVALVFVGLVGLVGMAYLFQIPLMAILMSVYIKELVTNALKHSSATTIDVLLMQENGRITLKVTDNGIGFKPFTYKSGSHQGLASIGEQVSLLDGTMNIQPATGGGTAVVISMPMNGGDSYENFVGR